MANSSRTEFQQNSTINSCDVNFNSSKNYNNDLSFQGTGKINLSPKEQGLIEGAIFLGFCFPLLLSGRISEIYGAKWVIFGGNLVAAICALVSPFASWWNVYAMIAIQLVRGISQGFVMPAVFVLVANWSPRCERGLLSSFVVSGYYVGSLIGGIIPGLLCDKPFLGWPSVFYFYGIFGILYCILFAFMFYETPDVHPRISITEKKYICGDQGNDLSHKRPRIPWCKMLTSIPVHVLLIAIFGHLWSVVYFLAIHSVYLSVILHYPIRENGLLSSLPFIFKIIGAWSANWFSNWLFQKKYLSVDKLRKFFNFLGNFGFSLGLLGVYFAKCDPTFNIIFFAFSVFSVGLTNPGGVITCIDMSPNFAGTLQGLAYTVGMTTGFIIPVMVRVLTPHQSLEEWHTIFFISIAVVLGSSIIFAIFGSAEVQPWNFDKDEMELKVKNEKTKESEKCA